MHSLSLTSKRNAHFNGDFSGDVLIEVDLADLTHSGTLMRLPWADLVELVRHRDAALAAEAAEREQGA